MAAQLEIAPTNNNVRDVREVIDGLTQPRVRTANNIRPSVSNSAPTNPIHGENVIPAATRGIAAISANTEKPKIPRG